MATEQPHRRTLLVAQSVEGAREEHRSGPRPGHGGSAGVVGPLQVVGAQRAKLGRQLRPASRGALVGVQTDREPCRSRGGEDPSHLVRTEGQRLAEGVHHVD